MPRILFVCTANLCRSPLAAALFSKKLWDEGTSAGWIVESAGTWAAPGQGLPADVRRAARVLRLDLTHHRTRRVDSELLACFDLILVMERGHKEALQVEFPFVRQKVHLLSEVADGLEYDIPDPVNSELGMEEIAAQLSGLIERAYEKICRLAQAPDIM